MKINDLSMKEKIQYIFIFLLLGILPLIVLCGMVATPTSLQLFYGEGNYDFFIYYKSRVLLLLVIVFAISAFYDFFINLDDDFNLKKFVINPIFIGTSLIIIFTILSFLFSDYKDVVLNGAVERYESIFIGIGYLFIMMYLASFCKSKYHVHLVIMAITFGAFFIGVIGLFQYLDFFTNLFPSKSLDPLNWDFFKLIYLGKYTELMDSLQFKFTQVYSTLYNPNYVGLYGAMYLPIGIAATIYYDKKYFLKWVSLVSTVLIFISTIGSKSDAAVIAFAGILFFALILLGLYFFKVLKNKKLVINFMIFFIVLIFAGIISIMAVPQVNNLYNTFLNAVSGGNFDSDIYSVDDTLYIKLHGVNQKIVLKENGPVEVYENEDNLLGTVDFFDDAIPNSAAGVFSNGLSWSLSVDKNITAYTFSNINFGINLIDNKIYLKNNLLEDVDINHKYPSIGFEGYERFGSGRGFIWARSLPIAFKSMFVGSGSDTFMLVFPQNDIRGKLLYIDNIYINVDKVHSTYLQYWINTGFVSLLGYLIILAYSIYCFSKKIFSIDDYDNNDNDDNYDNDYNYDEIKKLRSLSNDNKFNFIFSMGILLSIVGYSISALTADQNVAVSPIFWALIGISFSSWASFSNTKND